MYGSYEMYEEPVAHAPASVSVSDAREEFADLVNRAAYGHERVLLSRRGRAVAAIVPVEDVYRLERLEDEEDLNAARDALADPENAISIPWETVETDLDR